MVLSPDEQSLSPQPPDPTPELEPSPPAAPSQTNASDFLPKFTFPVLRPRSKRRAIRSFRPVHVVVEKTTSETERPWKLRSSKASINGSGSCSFKKNDKRPRFSVPLTPEEIEEDVYAITGALPRKRPKKRPRIVQKQIDMAFPGGWLSEVTVELYKVHEER